jgi:hypothetical protein
MNKITNMNKITYKGWIAELSGNILSVSKNNETREYLVDKNNNGIEYEVGEYFFIRLSEGFYYQFKFEENDFFVGDLFDKDDELIREVASYVFGEQ